MCISHSRHISMQPARCEGSTVPVTLREAEQGQGHQQMSPGGGACPQASVVGPGLSLLIPEISGFKVLVA